MKDILKEFVEEICPTCKGKCDKGITFIYGIYGEEKAVRCVDYIKDETKIEKTGKALYTTAKKDKPVMKNLV